MEKTWYCYFVRCNDNSLYAGVTTDVIRREQEHNSASKGAKYTRNKQPVSIVYYQSYPCRASACQQEYRLKQLSKKEKELLVNNFQRQCPKSI